jgi:hypothetical protein
LVTELVTTPEGIEQFVHALFASYSTVSLEPNAELLSKFLDFRCHSITRFVQQAAELAYSLDRAVGLDCFSPALTRMVGQDLGTLDRYCDWIKVMSYGHALAPAGIPFELLALANWLVDDKGFDETQALALLSRATHLPLPRNRIGLQKEGVPPAALKLEAQRARTAGVKIVLAGIELVEVEGITDLCPPQIEADLVAFREADVEGLALSWDLWEIPLEHLVRVRDVYAT